MRYFLQKSCLVGVLSVALVGCGGGAIDGTEEAAQALTRVQDRIPQSEVILQSQDDGFVATAGTLSVSVSHDAAIGVRTDVDGVTRGISVVGAREGIRPAQFNANTLIYSNTDRGVSTAFTVAPQADETVIESFAIIHNAQAPEVHRFALTLAPGESIRPTGDDTALIVDADGNPTAAIDARWAVDANGQAVPFSLAVDGNQIVMTVRHHERNFAYPVVADPALRLICGISTCSLYFSRTVTRTMITPSGVLRALFAYCGTVPYPPLRAACYALRTMAVAIANKSLQCVRGNQCLRVVFRRVLPVVPTGLFCDGSVYCSTR